MSRERNRRMTKRLFTEERDLTEANEDYLETIFELEELQATPEIRSVDIASMREVSKASVNKALQTLRDAGYIEQERYGRVTLTEKGRTYGRMIWGRHRALRSFLIDDLGVDEETANEEACMMEHTVSQDTMDRWVAWLERLHADDETRAESAKE